MPYCYGNGGGIGRFMERRDQPMPAKELPDGVDHGRYLAWRLYRCPCPACAKAKKFAKR